MTTLSNPDFLKSYQKSFADAVVSKAYAGRESLTGKDLLNLSPCKQLNFFVMKSLFNRWQDEMKRLESPYFDYKVPEVKKAMVQFMNVLSQNISVEPSDLTPLIEEAVVPCLQIVIEPAEFIAGEFEEKMDAAYSPKQVSQLLKYIKVLTKEFHELLLDGDPGTYADVSEKARGYFADVDLTEARELVFGQLSEIQSISLGDVTVMDEPEVPAEVAQIPEPQEEPVREPAVSELVSKEPSSENAEAEKRPATINDQFEKQPDNTVADHLERAGAGGAIIESISLNQRYMFAQELFSGDANSFQKAIGEIEHEPSFDQAVEYLVTNYAGPFEWDMNSDVVKELLKAVFRKFR